MSENQFTVGSHVEKRGGDYTFDGVIVSRFRKASGAVRYVVEDSRGLLFIFNASQLSPKPHSGDHHE